MSGSLFEATTAGEVDKFLEDGTLVDAKDEVGRTALSVLVSEKREEAAKRLLEKGADPNAVDSFGSTPLMFASASDSVPLVKLLLEHGALLEAVSNAGWTPLVVAAQEGSEAALRELLARGANTNVQDTDGSTALMTASSSGYLGIVTALLEGGADANLQDENGMTALMIAAGSGHLEVVEALASRNADLSLFNKRGWNALIIACLSGQTRCAEKLVDLGADLDATRDPGGLNSVLIASMTNRKDVLELLFNKGAKPDVVDTRGRNALMIACEKGCVRVFKFLLSQPGLFHLEARSLDFGFTALIYASANGHGQIVEDLVAAGADLEARTFDGSTSLFAAVKREHEDIAKLLIEKGSRVDVLDNEGNTLKTLAEAAEFSPAFLSSL